MARKTASARSSGNSVAPLSRTATASGYRHEGAVRAAEAEQGAAALDGGQSVAAERAHVERDGVAFQAEEVVHPGGLVGDTDVVGGGRRQVQQQVSGFVQ
jgi:hypothetical protein